MSPEERLAGAATLGLLVTAVGAFLPWARIGGRPRSGFSTADTFIGLAEGALPDAVAWVGRWWYAPAVLVVIAWASVFARGSRAARIGGCSACVLGLAMWWLYVWAGERYDVVNVRYLGPVVASIGIVTLAGCCARRRHSLLRPDPTAPTT